MIAVTDIAAVSLGTPRLAEATAFYAGPWGLRHLDRGGGSTGPAYLYGRADHPYVLKLAGRERADLLAVTLVVESPDDVDRAARELPDTGATLVDRPAPIDAPGGGYGLRFRDPAGLTVELRAHARPRPADPDISADAPIRIAHVGLNTPDPSALTDFYRTALGFMVTDEYEDRQTMFLACGPDHHRLVLVRGERTGVQHVAFEMDGVDGVMRGWGRMRSAGHETIWGPGRHGPGGNAFCYFEDPSGIVVEYSSAPLQIPDHDAWEPKIWVRSPENANVWGTGGPSPRAIALMTGRG